MSPRRPAGIDRRDSVDDSQGFRTFIEPMHAVPIRRFSNAMDTTATLKEIDMTGTTWNKIANALAAAAAAKADEQRHMLLDRAAIYAALGEKTRGYALRGR